VTWWALGAEGSFSGSLALVDMAVGGRWELCAHPQGHWHLSMSVTWQPVPVPFGVQEARGGEWAG
jgi:hypothetical protein